MDQAGYSRERNSFCHTILITFCRCQVLYFSRFSDSNQNVSFFAQFAFFRKCFIHFTEFCGIISLDAFPKNIRSTLWFSYDHTSGQILFKSAAILPYKITKFRLFFDAVLNPPYWNVNYCLRTADTDRNRVLNPPYWNVNKLVPLSISEYFDSP